jgi:hypothetical protein
MLRQAEYLCVNVGANKLLQRWAVVPQLWLAKHQDQHVDECFGKDGRQQR